MKAITAMGRKELISYIEKLEERLNALDGPENAGWRVSVAVEVVGYLRKHYPDRVTESMGAEALCLVDPAYLNADHALQAWVMYCKVRDQ